MTHDPLSETGIPIGDLVPPALRERWVRAGHCPDRDVHALFRERVAAHPHRDAVVDAAGGVLDYAGLDREVDRIAVALAGAGIGPGDIVGIRMPNGRRLVVAELAVAAVGAVVLAYPAGRGGRDTRSLLGRSRAAAAIFGSVDDAEDARTLPCLRRIFTFGAGESGPRSLDDAPPARWAARPQDAEAPVRILVTSGSEAEPKMIAYSHNAMCGGRANYVRALAEAVRPDRPMRALMLMSLASSYGSCATHVAVAALGATLVLAERYETATALELVARHRPSHVFGVPTMLRRLADHPPVPAEDLSSVTTVVSSAAPLSEVTRRAAAERFGAPVISVYGSSDGINCHTARAPDAPGAGLPDPSVAEIRIVDEAGRDVATGTSGEILARGPMTPLSYVADPELDARYRTPDGWVRSGDRGVIDEFGRLHVLGRLRQVVSRGGYHISPAEVEREIAAHPSVVDVACVGVPDDDLGERLCACLSHTPGTAEPTLPELTAFLEADRGLERRKLPELLVVLPELPLAPTGKVCRRTVTALATEHQHTNAPGEIR
ncbi:fatty acid--CoA ligase family protein [Saccharopolyspora sp. NFXS83]|uniref:class I adenylate-forming enzyme family protein n=1 Tax=Saccharopolyspora sp. NFXS83 TaxID=2993560 RepID=UPI00224AF0A4|nr:fatty acid--CoA ligase family protein [Saccharopolyspora sp. NFXS83]MCX2729635.1 fatty acid--CoA ligase family protein [Saccharopolyspora sp. NFXS83]